MIIWDISKKTVSNSTFEIYNDQIWHKKSTSNFLIIYLKATNCYSVVSSVPSESILESIWYQSITFCDILIKYSWYILFFYFFFFFYFDWTLLCCVIFIWFVLSQTTASWCCGGLKPGKMEGFVSGRPSDTKSMWNQTCRTIRCLNLWEMKVTESVLFFHIK